MANRLPSDEYTRIAIVQRCLEEEIFPRLIDDMPKPRSDKQRNSLRVLRNYVSLLIEGNARWMLDHRQKRSRKINS